MLRRRVIGARELATLAHARPVDAQCGFDYTGALRMRDDGARAVVDVGDAAAGRGRNLPRAVVPVPFEVRAGLRSLGHALCAPVDAVFPVALGLQYDGA